MNTPLIQTEDLSVAYGSVKALVGIDFQCFEGEFVSIVGKSGAGKSTFLNALAGFIPGDGRVSMPTSVGYVFQQHALYPWMTVAQNIGFGLAERSRKDRQQCVREMLKRIEMNAFAGRYPSELSGGQIQRVALARALAPNPSVLMMDEPYGALDHHTRDRMQDWLLSIWQESRKTVLFVTHYIEEALFLADRIVVVRDRRFVADVHVPFERPRMDDLRFRKEFLEMKHEVLGRMEGVGLA